MKESSFPSLEAVVTDEHFAEVDVALRRGRHLGREDGILYDYLVEARAWLEPFYQQFGADLVQKSDGYFYLLPNSERLGRRQLSAAEMLVGQALALFYLDPTSLQTGGIIARDALLQRLLGLFGAERLFRILHPQKRRYDERIAAEDVRKTVQRSLNRLAELGFVDNFDAKDKRARGEATLRLRPALMRFAEPVRGLEDRAAALERLVSRGEVTLVEAAEDEEAS